MKIPWQSASILPKLCTTRRQPLNWFGILLFVLLLWQTVSPSSLSAQSDPNPGTIPGGTIPGNSVLFLPLIADQQPAPLPPPTPAPIFDLIPVFGPPADRPATSHPDLNLAIRSYISTTGELGLININGDTDSNAPQLIGLFQPQRLPTFTVLYQVYDWDWSCGSDGCRGNPLVLPEVSLLSVATTPGETLTIPSRVPDIYAGGYKALVLYADSSQITLGYTREDTAAIGYVVHLGAILVEPTLLTLYNESDAAGRGQLPALRNNEPFATAPGTSINIAIRDTGSFMDPRSRKDWWVGFVSQ